MPQWVWVVGDLPRHWSPSTRRRSSRFGELEYWFALIKVVAILAFILVGLALVTGVGPAGRRPASINLFEGPGGFLPNGWTRRLAGADARDHELHGGRR